MTLQQLAVASRSDCTWLNNSRRLLRRPVDLTASGASWWGMVRMLNHELGIPLKAAERTADLILHPTATAHRVRIAVSADGSLALSIDLNRFHSTTNAAYAAALAFGQPRKRGRPKRLPRQKPPIDEYPSTWEIRVEDVQEKLDRLASQLREWNAYPRAIPAGLPFTMDATTLRAVPRLPLVTDRGDIDIVLAAKTVPAKT